jgi:hypothetical protein
MSMEFAVLSSSYVTHVVATVPVVNLEFWDFLLDAVYGTGAYPWELRHIAVGALGDKQHIYLNDTHVQLTCHQHLSASQMLLVTW